MVARKEQAACAAGGNAVRCATRRVAARDGLLPLLDGAAIPGDLPSGERHLPQPRTAPPGDAATSPISAFASELDLDRLRRLAAQSAWMKGDE